MHITEHLTLTLALAHGMTPHHHFQCYPHQIVNLTQKLILSLTSQPYPNYNRNLIHPQHLTECLTLTLDLLLHLTPNCQH